MPFFGLFWVTSWFSCFFSASQDLLKMPDLFSKTLPAKVLLAASQPLEKTLPATFALDLQPAKSIAATPAFSWQIAAEFNASVADRPASTKLNSSQPKIPANKFCQQAASAKSQNNQNSVPLARPAAFWTQIPASKVNKTGIPEKILAVVQHLFQWPPQKEQKTNIVLPSVVITRASSKAEVNSSSSNRLSAKKSPTVANAKLQSETALAPTGEFQVWVKEQLVAEIPDELRAKLMAQRLKEFLQAPHLDPAQLQPGMHEGMPALMAGDRLLFAIDSEMAIDPTRSRELLAISWVNNLRSALGAKPLSLADAQTRMYNLVETTTKIPGIASWYGHYFHGRLTANGERFNQYEMTAAHPSLPFNTYLRVKNLKNGYTAIVRINDRGPYIPPRTLDLSREAARCLDSEVIGVIPFEATIMQPQVSLTPLIGQKVSQ